MNLYLIENDASIDRMISAGSFDAANDLVVCFNYLPFDKLVSKAGGHRVHFIEEYLSDDDYKNLHEVTDEFARQWYMIDGKDLTLIENVSFGDITQILFSRTYLQSILVKYGEVVRKIIEQYPNVESVYYDLSNASNSFFYYEDDKGQYFDKEGLIRDVLRQLGEIPNYYIKPEKMIPPVFTGLINGQAGVGGIKNIIKSIILECFQKVHHILRSNEKKVYLFCYFNIDSLLEHTQNGYIFSAAAWKSLSALVKILDFDRVRYDFDRREEEYLETLRKNFILSRPPNYETRFTYNHIDYSRFYLNVIQRIVSVHIPELLKYYRRVQKGIGDFNIEKTVLVDVMTERGKTVVEACRNSGCRSVFVDHGIMGYRFAQKASRGSNPDLIIKPDVFDTQSDNYPYMIKAKSVQLGNPSTDHYTEKKRKNITSIKKILMHTYSDNFYARLDRFQYQELYFKELIMSIPRLLDMGMNILYRTHHENMAYHQYMFERYDVDIAAVQMSDFAIPFCELIYDVDLLICNISNTFYEALAAGVPVIFLEPHFNSDTFYPPLNGTNWEHVIRASSSQELIDIVKRNRENPSELNHFMHAFHDNHSSKYMHILDGSAGKRIVAYLNRI